MLVEFPSIATTWFPSSCSVIHSNRESPVKNFFVYLVNNYYFNNYYYYKHYLTPTVSHEIIQLRSVHSHLSL